MPSNPVSASVKENWTASEAVRKIEAGVLCKGFYFTGNVNDIGFGKEIVINVKDTLEYKGDFSKQTTFHEKFYSQEMTDRFERDIDKLSSSWAMSAQAGYICAARGSFQKANVKEDEMNRQEEKESSYFSVVYCDKAAVKSVDIPAKDVELTSGVIESLQKIKRTVKGNPASVTDLMWVSKLAFQVNVLSHTSHSKVPPFPCDNMFTLNHLILAEKVLSSRNHWRISHAVSGSCC